MFRLQFLQNERFAPFPVNVLEPVQWLSYLTDIFRLVFVSKDTSPSSQQAGFFNIIKKGNYSSISCFVFQSGFNRNSSNTRVKCVIIIHHKVLLSLVFLDWLNPIIPKVGALFICISNYNFRNLGLN